MTTKGRTSVLLAVEPGLLRSALRNLLRTIPQVDVIRLADDAPAALRVIDGQRAAVVLLDADLRGGDGSTVEDVIRAARGHSRCLVLTNDVGQKATIEKAGAGVAVVKGTHPDRLVEIIAGTLAWNGPEEESPES